MSTAGVHDRVTADALVSVHGMKKHFPVVKGLITRRVIGWVKAVDGVDFSVRSGETFGLVGESGCGKTTVLKCILLLERCSEGQVLFEGKDLLSLRGESYRQYRKSLQVVLQDPTSALNPRMRVEEIVGEPLKAQGSMSRNAIRERATEVLTSVGLSPDSASLYPHEFSGGQRQRIAIARALSSSPKCIILDEPVSALDVSIQAQILNLLKDLQGQLGLTYIVVAHNLAVVRYLSTTVGVMYAGRLVEVSDGDGLYTEHLHPYTQALLASVVQPLRPGLQPDVTVLAGEIPDPLCETPGCRFRPRCRYAKPICRETAPVLREVGTRHWVACHLYVS